jgi:cell division protein FtsN
MAARRNKTQARRNSGNGTPGWVWLVAGLVLGAALFFIVPGLMDKDFSPLKPQPNPDARPAPVADADSAGESAEVAPPRAAAAREPAPKETQYDFYTLLPGKEVQMSDAELAASARAEAERNARAQRQQDAADAAQPTPLAEDTSAADAGASTAGSSTAAASAAASAAAADASTATAGGDARYILQAGAFGGSGDAEATKARIALLGLSARVESAQIQGKTVYRVRMGPYGSASELAEAKQKLASGGLPAMAIRAQ